MSGLIGFLDFTPEKLVHIVQTTRHHLCRFSWNSWDWWTSSDGRHSLGRVDIGVFNPQPQPVSSPDGQVIALLSGELYHTTELRQELAATGVRFQRNNDPELALYAYLTYGPDFIGHLEGAFHLVIFDLQRQELLIANDRFGLRPLYYAHYQGKFSFAPEQKVLLLDPTFEKKLSWVAVAEYMRFQHLLGEKTFFEGISLLPAASVLRYHLPTKNVTIKPYWSLADIPEIDPTLTFADAVTESERLFLSAIERLSSGPQRVGLYLSGGLDSRLIAGALAKFRPDFHTITYGAKDARDVLLAKRIATTVGSQHTFCEFPDGKWVLKYLDLHFDLTEGQHSWIHSHGMSTLGQARDLFDVNLTGLSVDTLLGSSLWDPLIFEAPDELAFFSRFFELVNQRYTWSGLTEAEEQLLYTDKVQKKIKNLAFESLMQEMRQAAQYPTERKVDYFKLFHHNRRMTHNYVVFNSSHFENRFPGYDYALLDFVLSLPIQWRAGRQLEKAMIENINSRLALIPQSKDGLLFTNRSGRRLTHHIITRLKQRFNRHIVQVFPEPRSLYADYENWLRHELRDWATDMLLDGQLASRGLFNPEFVKSLLNRHFSGHELHTIGKIAPIMTFEMVMRRFFD